MAQCKEGICVIQVVEMLNESISVMCLPCSNLHVKCYVMTTNVKQLSKQANQVISKANFMELRFM